MGSYDYYKKKPAIQSCVHKKLYYGRKTQKNGSQTGVGSPKDAIFS